MIKKIKLIGGRRAKFMNNSTYWKRKYTYFIKNTLKKEQLYYEGLAKAMEEEIEYLIESKEKNLKDNPEAYVVFLHINHELNKLDPIGFCYPGIIYEYDKYAWEILRMYRQLHKEEFENSLNKYLKRIWQSIGISSQGADEKIGMAAKNIVEVLNKLYKIKSN